MPCVDALEGRRVQILNVLNVARIRPWTLSPLPVHACVLCAESRRIIWKTGSLTAVGSGIAAGPVGNLLETTAGNALWHIVGCDDHRPRH